MDQVGPDPDVIDIVGSDVTLSRDVVRRSGCFDAAGVERVHLVEVREAVVQDAALLVAGRVRGRQLAE